MPRTAALLAAVLAAQVLPDPVLAAPEGAHGVDGAELSLAWILPFAGILLSIAIFPLAAPRFWHHNYGSVAAFWALVFLVPFAAVFGAGEAAYAVVHTALLEYVPFIVLLFTLFTVAGGLLVTGNLNGSPGTNTGILAVGTLLASFIGTTGASMVLIRPLLRANDDRHYNVHVFVFFIFLVSNIGGSLTPLGDPPLFLGFLRGVDFFWPTTNLFSKTAVLAALLLGVFYVLDRHLCSRENYLPQRPDPTPDSPRLGLRGLVNIPLLLLVIAAILTSALWTPGIGFDVYGTEVPLQGLVRDAILLAAAGGSLAMTPREIRQANGFDWEPIREVAKLFAGIFVTIIPALAILKAGAAGALAPLVTLVTTETGAPADAWYFWLTGLLSSFLDNAPTYLVFFELAGGDAAALQTTLSSTLAAISAGAVFMGANTYIGNAPNFMVRSICEGQGVEMPSFFGYMGWSIVFLMPGFALITILYFR